MKYIKHVLGEFDQELQIQRCLICGQIIHDYRNCISTEPISGWESGEHFVKEGFPTIFTSSLDEGENFVNCK
jgi:hypothetical protein